MCTCVHGPLPDAIKPKRVSFLVSTYLCHMEILLRCLGKQHSKLKVHCSDHCSDRQPFVRNDFIPNGVLPISHVPRSWKIVIYMSASRCSLKNKNKQNIGRNPIEQFCKTCPYSSEFVRYSVGRIIINRNSKKNKMRKTDIFFALG